LRKLAAFTDDVIIKIQQSNSPQINAGALGKHNKRMWLDSISSFGGSDLGRASFVLEKFRSLVNKFSVNGYINLTP
jgi:hypothetical protein